MNLKNLCSLVLLTPILAWSQSSSQKTILFLDMNDNPKEIAVAQRAAKARGEKLIVIPKKVTKINDAMVIPDIKEELKQALQGNTISSLVLSGHNGGDSYSGEHGGISAPELMEVLEKSSSHNEIKSLYLLGCNSANKSKIFFWKASLPELKFIAGYDGTAPLGHLANGLGYFEDAMKKEKAIIQSSDAVKVKSLFESLKYVNTFQASLYTCDPSDVGHFFMSGRKGKERFGVLDTSECVQKLQDFQKKYLPEIKNYWTAKKEPTDLNPSSGFLKDAYVFMRQNEHCISGEAQDGILSNFTGDNLLFLRFNKDFNHNFVNYYRPLLEKTKAEYEEMEKDPAGYYEKLSKAEAEEKAAMKDLKDNPLKLKALIADELKSLEAEKEKIIAANPGMRQCLASSSPQCQRFRNVLVNYWDLEGVSYMLKDKDMVDMLISESTDSPSLSEQDFKDQLIVNKPKEISQKIQSLLDRPESAKRSELLSLSHSVIPVSSSYGNVGNLQTAFRGYDSMSGDVYPFSWHEVSEDKKVEEPFSKKYSLKSLESSNGKSKNPELKYLMRRISQIY